MSIDAATPCSLIRNAALESYVAWLAGKKRAALDMEAKNLALSRTVSALYYSGQASAFGAALDRFALIFPTEMETSEKEHSE